MPYFIIKYTITGIVGVPTVTKSSVLGADSTIAFGFNSSILDGVAGAALEDFSILYVVSSILLNFFPIFLNFFKWCFLKAKRMFVKRDNIKMIFIFIY